jgi:hypothetical protein
MSTKSEFSRPVRQDILLFLLFLTFTFAIGCGHSNSAPPEISIATIMAAVHQYGQAPALVASASSALVPEQANSANDTPETAFAPHVKSLLVQENFAELERIGAIARTQKIRNAGGVWQLLDFYEAVGEPIDKLDSTESWDDTVSLLKKWNAAYPESVTARLALANGYYGYGWAIRGQGYSDSVRDDAWRCFYLNIALSKSTLLEAAKLKERDPFWFHEMQRIARSDGWNKTYVREIFDQAIAFEPTYIHYYREYGNYLLPKWYGKPGDVQALAEEVSGKLSEPTASMAYFEIASLMCEAGGGSLDGFSWSRTKQGYNTTVRLYGTNNLKLNRFAYLSCLAEDKATAYAPFAQINDQWNHTVWNSKANFETARDWALNP